MAGEDRSWMDNRKAVGMRGCTEEFTREKMHGDHVDELDALIAMHTRKGPDGKLIWASEKHEKVFAQYKEFVRERAITEGIIDPNDVSNTRVPFEGKDWEDAIVISQGKKVGRGNKIFGFGNNGRPFLHLPTSCTHASSICKLTSQSSNNSKSIREQQLETEVNGLKEMMKKMKEQQEKDSEKQEQNKYLMQELINQLQQRAPWSLQQQYQQN